MLSRVLNWLHIRVRIIQLIGGIINSIMILCFLSKRVISALCVYVCAREEEREKWSVLCDITININLYNCMNSMWIP